MDNLADAIRDFLVKEALETKPSSTPRDVDEFLDSPTWRDMKRAVEDMLKQNQRAILEYDPSTEGTAIIRAQQACKACEMMLALPQAIRGDAETFMNTRTTEEERIDGEED